MKLNSAQVVRAVSQLDVEALPENHPLTPKLNQVFGDHTYFLDDNGLNIVEPIAGEMGVLVNLANWTDSKPPKLEAHEPELTDHTVELGTNGG
jgi:hypothetical protein